MSNVNTVVFTIVVILFVFVTVLGFVAAHWRRGDLTRLDEWGLAGRRFGTVITWFLLGGDLYTAYTFIAVPALVFGMGALGFFAIPYTIIIYPLVFVLMPRLWAVCRRHHYVTPADFVAGRYGSGDSRSRSRSPGSSPRCRTSRCSSSASRSCSPRWGSAAPASRPPAHHRLPDPGGVHVHGGLRAPALIALVKDTIIYLTVISAIIVIPARLGGWAHIFGTAQTHFAAINPATKKPNGTFIPTSKSIGSTQFDFATLAIGSGLALFLYPHNADRRAVVVQPRPVVQRNNRIFLPVYTVMLGLPRDPRLHGDRGRDQAPNQLWREHLSWSLALFDKVFPRGSQDSRWRRSRSAPWCPRR